MAHLPRRAVYSLKPAREPIPRARQSWAFASHTSLHPLVLSLSPLLSPPTERREGEEPGEMGSDSPPKKWGLREQREAYLRWFSLADDDGDGRVTGKDALKFFAMSNLSRPELKQVWAIADSKRQGYLGFSEFMTAMQLVSLAQAGNEISQDTLAHVDLETLLPPTMEGLDKKLKKNSMSKSNSDIVVRHPSELPASANWFNSKSGKKIPLRSVTSIIDGLKKSYIEKLRPLEKTYQFDDFVSPLLTSSDFDAKPMVMLLGQYSTGKTTFIKHLLKTSYPGAHIGPEPTTDRFVVITSGPDERCIPGNTIAVQADMPYSGLSSFGTAFLSKCLIQYIPSLALIILLHIFHYVALRKKLIVSIFYIAKLLDHITFVDTPGVLSGEKQRTQRSYDFTGVTSWFAAKCDLILLLFDPHKLDISDEFKRVIGSLKGHDDKIRIVLNKADQVDAQQLMRVYGALLWSLGKVLNTPEVMRVYIGYDVIFPRSFTFTYGNASINLMVLQRSHNLTTDNSKLTCDSSFNDKPIRETVAGPLGKELFEKEQEDLLSDLNDIPKKACDRRINEFVKRSRSAKVHAHIISHLKKEMPALMGKAKAQQRLLDSLDEQFAKVQKELHLPAGDFPSVEEYRETLSAYNFDKFERLKPKLVQGVDDMLAYDIPDLLKSFRNPYE
uniref:Dynamin-type G domain-containing protein n=1 Tax=Oryza meridionalis TaxID=40149 RepID=A0A0E0DJV7_9ORYZ